MRLSHLFILLAVILLALAPLDALLPNHPLVTIALPIVVFFAIWGVLMFRLRKRKA